jgi:hypothetical protein
MVHSPGMPPVWLTVLENLPPDPPDERPRKPITCLDNHKKYPLTNLYNDRDMCDGRYLKWGGPQFDPQAPGLPRFKKDGRMYGKRKTGKTEIYAQKRLDYEANLSKIDRITPDNIMPLSEWDPDHPNSRWHALKAAHEPLNKQQKILYLSKLEQRGSRQLALRAAGLTNARVDREIELDPVFAHAIEDALESFKGRTAATIVAQAIEGDVEYKYDRDGNVVGERICRETRLREVVLKGVEPMYREKHTETNIVLGGAVMVPLPASSEDEFKQIVETTGAPAKLLPQDATVVLDRSKR